MHREQQQIKSFRLALLCVQDGNSSPVGIVNEEPYGQNDPTTSIRITDTACFINFGYIATICR